jgi:hypothetical protein
MVSSYLVNNSQEIRELSKIITQVSDSNQQIISEISENR